MQDENSNAKLKEVIKSYINYLEARLDFNNKKLASIKEKESEIFKKIEEANEIIKQMKSRIDNGAIII
ncbi:hypothetical protein OFO10_02260 [Campylobacter sp. VBCF_06 NA8]|uniref:hypothetical protein n=1 Tax=Campylobacter sp. VBCF_06 NA8 TaxID=2983822 RepID=UPI0022E9F0D9|nr:hypothetical protein [Campylobacter sp. VBCF_06 NA8]MDA3045978.1 hypothetical protein [Campylobacter sp. VBCF_06 NA8]